MTECALARFLDEAKPLFEQLRRPTRPTIDVVQFSAVTAELRHAFGLRRERGLDLNPWDLAGISTSEIKNCAVLAGLVDPRRMGGAGIEFLTAILSRAVQRGGANLPVEEVSRGEYTVACETSVMGDWGNRVDVLVESVAASPGWIIAIEAKIGAGLQPDQLGRYLKDLDDRKTRTGRAGHLLFLSPYVPTGLAENLRDRVAHIRWADVAQAAQGCSDIRAAVSFPHALIRSFGDHVCRFDRSA